MTRQEQYEKHKDYIKQEGLDKLIDFSENIDYQEGVFDNVSGNLSIPFPPEADDLVRLHKLVRQRKCFTILEFGLGYSTLVFADALRKNQQDWDNLIEKPSIRNRFMFQLFSVDTSKYWINHIKSRIPNELADIVVSSYN